MEENVLPRVLCRNREAGVLPREVEACVCTTGSENLRLPFPLSGEVLPLCWEEPEGPGIDVVRSRLYLAFCNLLHSKLTTAKQY